MNQNQTWKQLMAKRVKYIQDVFILPTIVLCLRSRCLLRLFLILYLLQ